MKKSIHIDSENNFYYLFISIVVLLFVSSLLQNIHSEALHHVLNGLIVLIFFVDMKSQHHDSSWKKTIYVFVFLIALLLINKNHINPTIAEYIQHSIFLIYFIKSFVFTMKQIFSSKKVTENLLYGAVYAFLLLGLIWTFIYLLILTYNPEAFNGMVYTHWAYNFPEVSYFSFITLTTVGYGDVSPKENIAQFFVYAQAITGMFYMAITVSTIVSLRMVEYQKEHKI